MDTVERKQVESILQNACDQVEAKAAQRIKELVAENAALQAEIAERQKREEQLCQENRAKSEFLAMMSHELRTPLNAILGLSQILQQQLFGSLNPKQAEYVSHILQSGEHLLLLINDILDLAKVESGRETLTPVPLAVHELCATCLTLVREQAYDRGLQLVSQIDPTTQICVADERRLKQILLNLLSNAIKFTPAGTVSLIVEKQSTGITFTIKDTGIGIPSEKLHLLFQPFYQVDSQLDRHCNGTGLGLALTRNLARLHGGDVTVNSTLGQGSEFTVYLPDHSSAEQSVELLTPQINADAQAYLCSYTTRQILIVDADVANATLLQDYLCAVGHQVKHLLNSTDMLTQIRGFKPHLVLLSAELSDEQTGLDLLKQLRCQADLQTMPIVIVADREQRDDREKFLAAGATCYLSKPLEIVQLESLLLEYC